MDIANRIFNLIKGLGSYFINLFNWKKPPRPLPEDREDTSWKKFYKYPEWAWYLIRELIDDILIVLILLVLIRELVFEFRFIPSESMEPTMKVGDKLFVEKFSKRLPGFNRGDIVIFYPPAEATDGEDVVKNDPLSIIVRYVGLPFPNQPDAYIKRIVALPGETVEVRKDQGVLINGKPLFEPYHEGSPYFLPDYSLRTLRDFGRDPNCGGLDGELFPGRDQEPIVVPEKHYLVLGDNRSQSFDGHCWGFLPKNRIIGRAAFLIYRSLGEKPELDLIFR